MLKFAVALLLLIPFAVHADPITATVFLAQFVGGTIAAFVVTNASLLALASLTVFGAASKRRQARKAAARAKAEYNSGLSDRLITALSEAPPWRVMYGRGLTGGDIVAIFTSDKTAKRADGSTYTKPDGYKHLVIVLAAHQVQDIHELYLEGVAVGPTDGAGWATGGDFFTNDVESRSVTFVGSTTVAEPVVTLLDGYERLAGDAGNSPVTVTLSGGNTILTGPPGVTATAEYTVAANKAAVRWTKHLGADSQTVDTYLNGIVPTQWTANHRLRGLAYITLTLDLEDQRFQGGPPNILADMSGRLVYDYRTGTTVFTNNAALCAADFLCAPWGFDCDPAQDIDTAYIIAAANKCDESLSLTVGGVTTAGKRYAIDGGFTSGDGKEAILEDMCEAMAGTAVYGAQWMLMPGAWSTPVMALTDDDLHGSIDIVQAGAGMDEIFNSVRGTYLPTTVPRGTAAGYTTTAAYTANTTSIALGAGTGTILAGNVLAFTGDTNRYLVAIGIGAPGTVVLEAPGLLKPLASGVKVDVLSLPKSAAMDFEPHQNATFVTADGEELWTNDTLPYTNSKARAKNLSRMRVERNRAGLVISFPAKLRAWPLRVGDRVTVTSTVYGWTAKAFRVTDWSHGATSPVMLTLQEDAAEIWDEADAAVADPTPNTGLPSPWYPGAVNVTSIASGTSWLLRMTDGTIVPRVHVAWSTITSPYIADGSGRIVILWRRQGSLSNTRVEATGDSTSVEFGGVKEGDRLVIEVYAVNGLGQVGPSTILSHTVIGKTALPINVAGSSVTEVPGGLRFAWTPDAADVDYDETEWRTGASWAAGTLVWRGKADHFDIAWPSAGAHSYYGKHFDTSGNESATAAGLSVTVGAGVLIDTGNIKDNAATLILPVSFTGMAITGEKGVGGPFLGTVSTIASIAFTPVVTGSVLVVVDGKATTSNISGTPSNAYLATAFRLNGSPYGGGKSQHQDQALPATTSAIASFTRSIRIAVTAGVPYTVELVGQAFSTADNACAAEGEMRVEEIRK